MISPLSRRELALAGLLCALAVSAFLSPALVAGRLFSPADLLYGYYPWHSAAPAGWTAPGNNLLSDDVLVFEPWLAYAAQRLHAGEVPLWNPDNMLGAPFLGNMQSAVLYPLNWPYFIWPNSLTLALRAWLKLLVAALGTYVLARQGLRVGPLAASLAAITFTFGAFLTVWLLYPHTSVAIWLPWLWWATARLVARPGPRPCALLAGFAALTLLAGQPEMALHVALATGAFALFLVWQARARGIRTALQILGLGLAAYVLAALLAAVQLLPFGEYLTHSAAWLGPAHPRAADFWLPAYLAWTAVSPDLFGNPAYQTWWDLWTNYNEANSYSGVLPLLLAPFALAGADRARRALAVFLLALGLLAAGVVYHAPVVFEAITALPGLSQAANQRLLLIVEFALALLAALGLDGLLPSSAPVEPAPVRRIAPLAGLIAWTGILLAAGVGVPLLAAHSFFRLPDAAGPATAVWQAGLWRAGGLILGSGLLLAGVIGLGRRRPPAAGALALVLPLILFADLALAHAGYNPTVAQDQYYPPTAVTQFLQTQPPPFRTVAAGWLLPANTNLPYGLADLRGYDALEPQGYHELAVALDPSIFQGPGGGFKPFNVVQSPLLDLLNVRYVLTAPGDDPNYRFDVRQEAPAGPPAVAITATSHPGQTFVAGQDTLTEIQVLGTTAGQHPAGSLIFHLRTDPAAPGDLVTRTLATASLVDDTWWRITFPAVRQARGRSFYFYFEAPGPAVSLYYSPGNPYQRGTRTQDGQPVAGDLVFRTVAQLNPDDPPFVRVLDGGPGGANVYLNRQARPRAWLVHQVAVVAPGKQLRRLVDPGFDPARLALLDSALPATAPLPAAPLPGGPYVDSDQVTIDYYAPEQVAIGTASTSAGVLVLADQAFPGWEAQVDGGPAPILTVDHALRGVYLPAGAHQVRFTYHPLSLAGGAALTLGGGLVWLFLAAWPRLYRRRAARGGPG
ncbi:MAG TPA: hypothetical protein VKY74_23520 [Chloroflexia bacterium]|nr:hypothetical protein [Chloroflexia bacterium]